MKIDRRAFIAASVGTSPFAANSGAATAMTPETSVRGYRDWLKRKRLQVSTLTVQQIVLETIAFYENVRCNNLSSAPRSDMLLYQWGVYDWGQGPTFEFDITRQFIERFKEDDDAISQFRVTAHLDPIDDLRAIKAGNRWCERTTHARAFQDFIEKSQAYQAASRSTPMRVVAEWSPM